MSKTTELLHAIERMGIVRARDVIDQGISPVYLQRLCRKGVIDRISRGTYQLSQAIPSPHHTMAVVAKRVPHGVVCLLSALHYHHITTQSPPVLWMAIDRKAMTPRITDRKVSFIRSSRPLLTVGCEQHLFEGVEVTITTPARTVVDCFKYRHKIGLDIAIEALRDVLHRRACTIDDLWHFSGICRVRNVMRPYLEALT